MKNIELKVAVENFKEVTHNLKKIGAILKGTFSQIDTYYKCQKGRLKIREINHKIFELISYNRPDQAESKVSDYSIKHLDKKELKRYRQHLNRSKGLSVRVIKKRELWVYKKTRIHLDKVRGLGKFLELETVIDNLFNLKQLEEEHEEVIDLLNLSHYKKISISYSDLLLGKTRQRKESTLALLRYTKHLPV